MKVIVIGAGIVGLACSLRLQACGHEVELVERDEPGHGCSFGNAGIIATAEISPLVSIERIAALPRMLLDPDGPVAIKWAGLPQFLPWLLRAMRTAAPERQRHVTEALATLNRRSLPAWHALLRDADVRGHIFERGMIELARSKASSAGLPDRQKLLQTHGMSSELLSPEDITALEPDLRNGASGLLLPGTAHVDDPFDLTTSLLKGFMHRGGALSVDEIQVIAPSDGGVLATGFRSHAGDAIVVATGLAAAGLLGELYPAIPLFPERGYHLTLPGSRGLLTRPVTFLEESCVATPMNGGLRLAGTIEFAPSDAEPDWRRALQLADFANRYVDVDIVNASHWVGSRPSLPDSLPAIGRLKSCPQVAYAFGHQHLGLTQAAITADLVAALLSNTEPSVDPRPYAIERFGRGGASKCPARMLSPGAISRAISQYGRISA